MYRPLKTSLFLLILLTLPLLIASPQLRIISVSYDREISYKSKSSVLVTVEYSSSLRLVQTFLVYALKDKELGNYSWTFVPCRPVSLRKIDGKYLELFNATIPLHNVRLRPNMTILFYAYAFSLEGEFYSTINATAPLKPLCEGCFRIRVIDDVPPVINEVRFIPDKARTNMSIKVVANVTDESPLRNVSLTAWLWRGEDFSEEKVHLKKLENDLFIAELEIPPLIEEAWYMLRTEDVYGNVNVDTGRIEVIVSETEALREELGISLKVYLPALIALLSAVVISLAMFTIVLSKKGTIEVTGGTLEAKHPKSLNISLLLLLAIALLIFYEVRPHGMTISLLTIFFLLASWYLIDPRTPSMPGLTALKAVINDNPFSSLIFEGVILALISGGVAATYLIKLLSPASLMIFSKLLKYSVILLSTGLILQALWPALRNIKVEFELVEEEEERRSKE